MQIQFFCLLDGGFKSKLQPLLSLFKKFEISRWSEPKPDPSPSPDPTRVASHLPCNSILIRLYYFYIGYQLNENQVYYTVLDNYASGIFAPKKKTKQTKTTKKQQKKQQQNEKKITSYWTDWESQISLLIWGENVLGVFLEGIRSFGFLLFG